MSVLRSLLAPLPMFLMNAEGGGDPAPAPAPSPAPAPAPDPAPAPAPAPAAAPDPSPAPAPAPAPAPLASGADDPAAPPSPAPAPKAGAFAWPDGWRDQLAEQLKPGDKAFRQRLERLASPTDVAKSWLSLETRLSSGELKPVGGPPKDATPEQLAAWRQEQGLPADAKSYVTDLKLPGGMVPGEADTPLLEALGTLAHERGWKQDVVNDVLGLYYTMQESIVTERKTMDGENRNAMRESLAQELGADLKPNQAVLRNLWTEYATPEVKESILMARTDDGRLVGDNPDVVKFLMKLGRELNPAAAVLPSGQSANITSVKSRISEIDGMMYDNGKPNPAYWNNNEIQQEYRDLIVAQEKLEKRSAA